MSVLPDAGPAGAAARRPGPAAGVLTADPDRRFYAFAADRLFAWGAAAAVAVVAGRPLWSRGHHPLAALVVVATLLAVELLLAVLLGTTGATPGKSLLGLRVVDAGSGEPLGIGLALLRTLVLALAGIPFGFGLAALAWTSLADTTRLRRGWHDHLVSSIVLDNRPAPVMERAAEVGPRHVVNLTAARLVPSPPASEQSGPAHLSAQRPTPPSAPAAVPGRRVPEQRPAAAWRLVLDTGELVVVDTLVLLGRRPEPRQGEQGARLLALPSADRSVSATHAQVVVAADGALVLTDRGSTHGSTLVRKGLPRPLTAGRPTTLLAGDVVRLGDRSMTVERVH